MKTLKEYLAESKKVYNFKIKVAGELPESFQDNLKQSLERCKVVKLEKIKSTPVQALPLDFPTMKNVEVHMFEIICEYPITAPEIVSDIKALGLQEECFRVRGSSEPSEVDQATKGEILNPDGLLNDSQYKESVNVKHKDYFGDDFNRSFLKDLEKSAKQRKKDQTGPTEYKLPKAKEDKTGLKSAMGSK
jgi:hypothetical protein